MNAENTLDLLSQLVLVHRFSLVRYLGYARPWTDANEASSVLVQVADMQNATADRLESLILARDRSLPGGDFSMQFTSWHDLALGFLLPKTVEHQRGVVAACQDAISGMDDDQEALAMAEEALGEAKGHLETLIELADAIAAK